MEIFKTAHGSWIYPEANVLRIGGVPLFSGFMYACIGSYMARAMRLAVEAGWLAAHAGRIPKKLYASASSPEAGLIE